MEWVGLFMEPEELLAWIGDPEKSNFTDNKLIKDQALDGPMRNAFAQKMKSFISLHLHDIEIHKYFMSNNNGLIAWLHLEAPVVERIQKETSRIPARQFKCVPFIPEIARTRKKAIDNVLLNYKRKTDDSLRYIIRNGDDDLKVGKKIQRIRFPTIS